METRPTRLALGGLVLALSVAVLPASVRAQEHAADAHAAPHAAAEQPHEADAAAPDAEAHGSPIETSRPGLAEYTGVVSDRTVQVEAGYSLTRLDEESRHALGEVRVRYGLGLRSELRVNLNSYVLATEHGHESNGFEDAGVSFKTQLSRGEVHPVLPAIAVQVGSTVPTGSEHFGHSEWQPRAAVSLGWELPGHLGLTTSAQYARVTDHGELASQATTAAALSLPLSHHLHAHAEYAAIAPVDHWSERMDHVSGGFGYHLSDDLQIDVWTGAASHAGERELLFGVGISRRWGAGGGAAHH